MNLSQYCLTNASPDPHKTALEVVGENGKPIEIWTYADLTETILSVAAGLGASGFGKGDRVLLRLGHSSDFPLLFFGAIAAGCVPVPTSAQLTEAEASAIAEDCDATVVLHDGQTALPSGREDILWGPDRIADLKRTPPGTFAATAADDPAFLVYTSGTSGRPKGVLHAQRAAAARAPMYQDWYGISENDRLLHAGAFNWTYTLGVGLMDPWANGATSIVYDGPREPHVWPAVLEGSDASLFAAVPSLYRRILKYADLSSSSFPQLRHALTAGEALQEALYAEWKAVTGRELNEALGMSEVSTYISSAPRVPVRPGSPGKPQTGRKVAILSETSPDAEPVARGEIGLLAVHRNEPGLMLGYWNRGEETAESFKGDWFLTGDRAREDEDGYYWYEGRADDLMNAFGYRVAPEEVERVLTAHPDVTEAAVTAVTVSSGISLVTAFIVPSNPDTFSKEAIDAEVSSQLADYKRPKDYRIVTELPRTPSGKLQRKALLRS